LKRENSAYICLSNYKKFETDYRTNNIGDLQMDLKEEVFEQFKADMKKTKHTKT